MKKTTIILQILSWVKAMIDDRQQAIEIIESLKTLEDVMLCLDKVIFIREQGLISRKEFNQLENVLAKKAYSFMQEGIEKC